MAVDSSAVELTQVKPTQAETAAAWNGQGPDARHIGDGDIIKKTVEVTDPVQPQPETSKMQGVKISEDSKQQAYDQAKELGDKAAKYSDLSEHEEDLAVTKAKEAGILAKLASMIGRKN